MSSIPFDIGTRIFENLMSSSKKYEGKEFFVFIDDFELALTKWLAQHTVTTKKTNSVLRVILLHNIQNMYSTKQRRSMSKGVFTILRVTRVRWRIMDAVFQYDNKKQ